MARPVRTSNLLKEAAADHENLDRKNWMRSFRRTFLVNLRICLIVRMSIRKSR